LVLSLQQIAIVRERVNLAHLRLNVLLDLGIRHL
jgi:hypothetical protein